MALVFKLLPGAQEDLDASLAWYEQEGGNVLAQRFFDFYLEARNRIAQNPDGFRTYYQSFHGIRFRKFPFKIIYAIEGNEIIIVAVAHDKREPNYWRSRVQ